MGVSLQMIGSLRLSVCDCVTAVTAREVFVMQVFMRLDGMRGEASIFGFMSTNAFKTSTL